MQPDDELYLLGDYIDRGPDSKGVLDFILDLRQRGFNLRALYGNHEDMLMAAKADPESLILWLVNGGDAALESFKAADLDQIEDKYWEFISELEFYIELEDYILVHAGFNFAAPDPFTDTESMIWIRDFDLDESVLGNRSLVHGHTPTPLDEIYSSLQGEGIKDINIDGGCVFKQRLGYLTALNLDTLELHTLRNME